MQNRSMDGDKPVIRDLQRINGAVGLASLQAPSLRLNCLSSLWLAFLSE